MATGSLQDEGPFSLADRKRDGATHAVARIRCAQLP
jgi:hypothetical protein